MALGEEKGGCAFLSEKVSFWSEQTGAAIVTPYKKRCSSAIGDLPTKIPKTLFYIGAGMLQLGNGR